MGFRKSSCIIISLVLVCSVILSTGCGNSSKSKSENTLFSMGTSISYPFLRIVFKNYNTETGNTVINNNFNTGTALRSLRDRLIDMAVTSSLPTKEIEAEFNAEMLYLPVCISGIAIVYNLPGVDSLNLTGALISDIYLGNITNWNNKAIQAINKHVTLPDLKIIPLYRADENSATFVFSNFLSKVDSHWKEKMGHRETIRPPSGISQISNTTMSAAVNTQLGSIGYSGLQHAIMANNRIASVQNQKGEFIKPTSETLQAALENVNIGSDLRILLTNSPNEGAYPLTCMSWFVVYKHREDSKMSEVKFEMMKNFFRFLLTPDQQKNTRRLSYVSLPEKMIQRANELIDQMN